MIDLKVCNSLTILADWVADHELLGLKKTRYLQSGIARMLGITAAYDVLTRILGEVFSIIFHCHSYQDHGIFLYQIPLIFPLEPHESFYQLPLSFLLGPWVLYHLSLMFPLGPRESSSPTPWFVGVLCLFRSNAWSDLYPLPWPQGNWTSFRILLPIRICAVKSSHFYCLYDFGVLHLYFSNSWKLCVYYRHFPFSVYNSL